MIMPSTAQIMTATEKQMAGPLPPSAIWATPCPLLRVSAAGQLSVSDEHFADMTCLRQMVPTLRTSL